MVVDMIQGMKVCRILNIICIHFLAENCVILEVDSFVFVVLISIQDGITVIVIVSKVAKINSKVNCLGKSIFLVYISFMGNVIYHLFCRQGNGVDVSRYFSRIVIPVLL